MSSGRSASRRQFLQAAAGATAGALVTPYFFQNSPLMAQDASTKSANDRPVLGWCGGDLQPGRPGAFVVALGSETGGTYTVVGADARVVELAPFARQPSLACYTRADAEKLGRSVRESEAIHGHVTPRWKTTVICGFTDETSAVCWQYSPADRAFVVVGKWIT